MRTTWTERDEKGFEEFVQRIGESGCRNMHTCLVGVQSNPLFRASNPPGMHFYADCADLPYMLRAYYAWKNGLPFSYSVAVTPLGFSKDIRYTARGNAVSSRRDLVEASIDARKAIPQVVDAISSAHYRYPPSTTKKLLPDHYPVRIARDTIKPGTIIYDPNGHVAVVYKVTPDGRIHYIDTHPDNSLTRGVYGKAFTRSSPAMGAGFKRWRPQTLVGATQRPDGSYHGGHIVLAADKDIADWSDEQFFGTEKERPKAWNAGKFVLEGETLEYYDYVRRRLANAGFKYNPLDETRAMVRALCEDLKYRVDAVDVAIKANIHKRPQPDRSAQQHLRHRRRLGDLLDALARCPPQDRLQGAARRDRPLRDAGLPPAATGWPTPATISAAISVRSICRKRAPAPSPTPGATAARSSSASPRWRGGSTRSPSIPTTARSAGGERRTPRSSRPAPTAPTSAPGTTPSAACATNPTAPTTCAWASRWPT